VWSGTEKANPAAQAAHSVVFVTALARPALKIIEEEQIDKNKQNKLT